MNIATKLTDLTTDLRNCRKNILAKGGQISDTAGFAEVAEQILEIPSGTTSVGTVVDDSISTLKLVPANSITHCYISKLGGYTHIVPDDSTVLAPIRLENAKPTKIKIHGANVIDTDAAIAYMYKGAESYYTKDGNTYTLMGLGIPFARPYKFTEHAEICTLSIESSSNQNYVVPNLQLGYLDENGQFTRDGRLTMGEGVTTVTSTGKVNAFRIAYSRLEVEPGIVSFSKLRINYGTVDCGFTPYHEPVEITLPESITELPNLGLGVYDHEYNECDLVNQKYIQRCNTKTFAGSDAFTRSDLGSRSRFNLKSPNDTRGWSKMSVPNILKCDYLEIDTELSKINGDDTVKNKMFQYQNEWYFYVDGNEFPDVGMWNLYLSAHPMEVVYEIDNEIVTDIDTSDFNPLIEVEAGGSIEFITDSGYTPNSTVIYQTLL